MKNFNFKSATNTKEATKLASGRSTFLAGGMTSPKKASGKTNKRTQKQKLKTKKKRIVPSLRKYYSPSSKKRGGLRTKRR